jgi:hypothetical protein
MGASPSYLREWRETRIANKICPRCGGPLSGSQRVCTTCLAVMLKVKTDRVATGGCYNCISSAAPGRKYCLKCAQDKSDRQLVLRYEVIMAYGGKCMCPGGCDESRIQFLTFDHVNNDGAEHRRTVGPASLAGWLKRNNYPSSVRILCYNCNCARRLGRCPHEAQGLDVLPCLTEQAVDAVETTYGEKR